MKVDGIVRTVRHIETEMKTQDNLKQRWVTLDFNPTLYCFDVNDMQCEFKLGDKVEMELKVNARLSRDS